MFKKIVFVRRLDRFFVFIFKTLQNYRNETHETQELGPHTLRKRKVRTGRKKGERQSKADPKRSLSFLPFVSLL